VKWQRAPRWTESQLFVAALVLPFILYDLTLHLSRLSLHFNEIAEPANVGTGAGLLLTIHWLLGDIAFALLACVLLLVRNQHGRLWVAVAIVLQIGALALGLINTASHVYFMQTADALDWPLLNHMFWNPHDLGLLLAGEVTVGQWCLCGMVFVLAMVGPWLVRAWALRAAHHEFYLGRERRSRAVAFSLVLLTLPAVALGSLPPGVAVKDRATAQSPVFYVASTALAASRPIDPAVDQAIAAARFFEPGRLSIERVSEKPPRNLVIVILESTRARAVTPYEPSLQTTPFLDSLARRSLVVDKAYAVIPSTAKALTAIFCSIYPSLSLEPRALTTGLLGRCLPKLLAEQGYQTLYMQTANPRFEGRLRAVPSMGFETFLKPDDMPSAGYEEANFLGREDDMMLGPSEQWLRAHREGPIFAAYLTVNAHHDYNRLTRHGDHHFFSADDALDRYLNNVHADDVFLRSLFAQYAKLGLLRNTLFVIVADHGEAFGEHGRRAHNSVPYEEALRVPMLFHDPTGERVQPGHLPGPVSQLDILPTVLELLGFRIQSGRLHGISIFDSPPDRVLITSCLGTCMTRVTASEAVIHHFGRRSDELYDLQSDPLEQNDLAKARPLIVQQRVAELRNFQRRLNAFFFFHALRARQPEARAP